MRITHWIFAGSVIALTALAAPALAKGSDAQKSEDKQASQTPSSCHAYQQAADGSWTALPCAENGLSSQTTTQHKPIARGPEQETH